MNKIIAFFWTLCLLFNITGFSQNLTKPILSSIVTEDIFNTAPFKQCHASTLIELKKGKIMAAWFGGTHENCKDVCIWASVKQNGRWSAPYQLVCGEVSDTLRYACWNPVLFRTGKNTLTLFYKVGPTPRDWWGMAIYSSDNGKTWSKAKKLNGILGPIRNKPIQLASGTWLNPTSTETLENWNVLIERSTNKGKSWKLIPIDTANVAKVIQPTLLTYPGDRIQALCRSDQNYILESWSTDDGKTWSNLQKTNVLNPNSGIDAVTLRSGLQVLVYNPMESGKDWVNGRNKLNVCVSRDGKNWTDIYKLEDQAEGEFSYPAIVQSSDNSVHISYTYNRKTIKHVSFKLN